MSNFKNVQPLDNFNWEEFENGGISEVSKEEQTASYDSTLNKVSEHQVVDGTVISIDKKEVIVNIGYKSDGVIAASEFRYNPDLKVGDVVEVYVENQEDKKGQLILSHKKARLSKSWDRVNAALDNEEVVQGYIKCRTKGGMIVDVFGIEAFLPGSQIDVHPIRDYDVFVGKTMEFKIVKINQEFRNVVVSHKALIEQELEAQRKEIISKLEKGQVLEGTVKNITNYGVFVDLGGVDGLINIHRFFRINKSTDNHMYPFHWRKDIVIFIFPVFCQCFYLFFGIRINQNSLTADNFNFCDSVRMKPFINSA